MQVMPKREVRISMVVMAKINLANAGSKYKKRKGQVKIINLVVMHLQPC